MEPLYKLQPTRTIHLQGFSDFGAAAALHSASETGFKVSGVFRDPADFAVLVLWDHDDFFGQPPQIVATMPILEGIDGAQKMSKSLGNYIGITEPPEVMYRKVMQISDELMYRYYELLTDLSLAEIAEIRKGHPMEAKKELARRIVTDFHSAADAERAAEAFRRVVQEKEAPEQVPVFILPESLRNAGRVRLDKLLFRSGLAESISDAARKLKAGAVRINGVQHRDPGLTLEGQRGELLIQVGKQWRRVRW